jgi:Sec23/Sec24 trunk domain
MPVADCSFTLEKVLEELQRDPWPVPPDQRVARCTGAALEVLLFVCLYSIKLNVMSFKYHTHTAQHMQCIAAQEVHMTVTCFQECLSMIVRIACYSVSQYWCVRQVAARAVPVRTLQLHTATCALLYDRACA